jgi:hypothetical protein
MMQRFCLSMRIQAGWNFRTGQVRSQFFLLEPAANTAGRNTEHVGDLIHCVESREQFIFHSATRDFFFTGLTTSPSLRPRVSMSFDLGMVTAKYLRARWHHVHLELDRSEFGYQILEGALRTSAKNWSSLRNGHLISNRGLAGHASSDLAPFNLAIDSKLRGCGVVALKVEDVGCVLKGRAAAIFISS